MPRQISPWSCPPRRSGEEMFPGLRWEAAEAVIGNRGGVVAHGFRNGCRVLYKAK